MQAYELAFQLFDSGNCRVYLFECVFCLGDAGKRALRMVIELPDGGVDQVIEVCD